MIRLFGRPTNRTWNSRGLAATEWRSRSHCIILCRCLFHWPACGANVVVRWERALGKFKWKVRGLGRLVDRTLEYLPWFQVEGHGIGIWFTLIRYYKCEGSEITVRTLTWRVGRRVAPAETCCCIPFTRNRGESVGLVSLRLAATAS